MRAMKTLAEPTATMMNTCRIRPAWGPRGTCLFPEEWTEVCEGSVVFLKGACSCLLGEVEGERKLPSSKAEVGSEKESHVQDCDECMNLASLSSFFPHQHTHHDHQIPSIFDKRPKCTH